MAKQIQEPNTDSFPCTHCAGCGQIADTEEGEPWKYWLELPVGSALAVIAGIVKPIPCPMCQGSGQINPHPVS